MLKLFQKRCQKISHKIQNINIRSFKGIPKLDLEIDGKSLVLLGDNGTGKSSLVDALEYFFTGDVLNLKGTQGISLKKYGHHVNYKSKDLEVNLSFRGGLSLIRNKNESPSPPENLLDFFNVANERKFILHRKEILEYILSKPAEKFRAIGNIIGIGELDEVELNFKRAHDKFSGEFDSKKNLITQVFKDISNILNKSISNKDDALKYLNESLKELELPSLKSTDKVEIYQQKLYKNYLREEVSTEETKIINDILNKIEELIPMEIISTDTNNREELRGSLLEETEKTNIVLLDILNKGQQYFTDYKTNVCPICQQSIIQDDVLTNINKRLQKLNLLSENSSKYRKINQAIFNEINNYSTKMESLLSLLNKLNDTKELIEKLKLKYNFLEKLKSNLSDMDNRDFLLPTDKIISCSDDLREIFKKIITKYKKDLKDIELTEKEKNIIDINNKISKVKSKIDDFDKYQTELDNLHKSSEISQIIYTSFSQIKKQKVQDVFNDLQEDLNSFYGFIHEDDEHKNLELSIDPNKRASMSLTIESFGISDVDPRAYSSEGHLDTLGLCIFLAFVKKFNEGCPLIIMDDVLTTVDANHREKVAELIIKEFKDYQMIITTHDQIWFEQLIGCQDLFRLSNKFLNYKIVDWDLNNGPKIADFIPRWEGILKDLDEGDKEGAGGKVRNYLEAILKKLCENLEVQIIPKSSGKYMVAELFNPFVAKMKKRVKKIPVENKFKQKLLDIFKIFRKNKFMINLLAHDNPEIKSLTIEEVRNFCDLVHNLHTIFLCPECQRSIKYVREFNEIRCFNQKCRNPLIIRLKT